MVVRPQNMVGPGEVDGDLADEVSEKCAMFGRVTGCKIYEASGGLPPEDCVRIFVQFDAPAAAAAAVADLHGRYFAKRQVRAQFFDPERFNREDLAPAYND